MAAHRSTLENVGALGPAVLPASSSLKETYNRYFQVQRADTEERRDQVFRLRYAVYCIEHSFEPIENNPDGRERDRYDSCSLHSLLIHRPTGAAVGTVRLIMPRWDGQAIELPIRSVCDPAALAGIARRVPPERWAEISRFAVTKDFRRRSGDNATIVGGLTEFGDPRRVIPQISLGLMRAIVEMSASADITHLYAVMEPKLLRMLTRLGIHFETIGPVVEYHGTRQPCFCDLGDLLSQTLRKRPDVWAVITDEGRLWAA